MHPAAGLRRQEMRTAIIQDFKAIPEVLDEAYRAPAAADPEPETAEEAQEPPTQQLNLF